MSLRSVRELRVQPPGNAHEKFSAVVHVGTVARPGNRVPNLPGCFEPKGDRGVQFLDRFGFGFAPRRSARKVGSDGEIGRASCRERV